ncbi:MAG: hypothetical protein M3Q77_03780 [Thermoproteota archaeon]|nr:hypothetical protein [Thermoproteota archaeon]
MNNKFKVNTSKGKLYLTVAVVVAIASLLVMAAFNVNANSMNANAFDIDNPDNKKDIGKSEECVKVVVGCGGQGTVGDNKPVGPIDPAVCEECLADLSNAQREALITAITADNNANVCLSIEDLTADKLLELLLDLDVDLFVALDILDCLGVA